MKKVSISIGILKFLWCGLCLIYLCSDSTQGFKASTIGNSDSFKEFLNPLHMELFFYIGKFIFSDFSH